MPARCNACSSTKMAKMFDLGEQYLSNFIPQDHSSVDYPKSRLKMMCCGNCGTGQLSETINPSTLYQKYWYYSGVNETMNLALKDIVDSVVKTREYEYNKTWIDIASNDGTLLKHVPSRYYKIGIDPSNVAELSKKYADEVINDFFSKESLQGKDKASVITCIAMFYDLANPHQFLEDVYDVLEDDGVFVIQMSYTPLMFRQLEIGNVCAEHVMYYSLYGLSVLLKKHDFSIRDCILNDVNGGSFRVYCTKGNSQLYKTQQEQDVAQIRIESLLAYERSPEHTKKEFKMFGFKVAFLKDKTLDFIKSEVASGKRIYGLGASTKGNTLLQYFGLDNTLITKIAERNQVKHGLKTIGTEIPICSEEEMRQDRPDYLLVLPWHFIAEMQEREKEYLQNGGKLIVPCPEFRII